MLNRAQVYELLLFNTRRDRNNKIPKDVIRKISDIGFDPNSDIAELLHYIVYGNVAEIKRMLDANPELLREVGNVETPDGDTVLRVTPYECAFGTGDTYKDNHGIEMIPLIAAYFAKLQDGEAEQARQTANMKPYIDNMLNQKLYAGFSKLFEVIKSSPLTDVSAALEKNFTAGNALHDALDMYRHDRSPRTIVKGMHYNYANPLLVLKMLDDQWNNLVVNGNYDKCRLVMRQIFGWELRSLPMCDRQALAGGLYDLLENKTPLIRSLKFKNDAGDFPITAADKSKSGLGWDFWVDVSGWVVVSAGGRAVSCFLLLLQNYFRAKASDLQNLSYAATCGTKSVRVCDFMK